MDPNILQSLHEIASLLLLLHDSYLKNIVGSEVLVALVTLLKDVQLDSRVSILDAERLRKKVMKSDVLHLGYELFYEWLRDVGQLVYQVDETGGKRALHLLLTEYILPYASSFGKTTDNKCNTLCLPYYTETALDIFVRHADFLILWFFSIVHKAHCLTPFYGGRITKGTLWNALNFETKLKTPVVVDVECIIQALREVGLVVVVPDDDGDLRQMTAVTNAELESILLLLNIGPGDNEEDSDEHVRTSGRSVDFHWFLYLLELLSERITLGTAVVPSFAVNMLNVILVNAATSMFNNATAQLCDGTIFDSITVLRPSAILKWLRSSGIILLDAVDIPWLYQQLTIYADYDTTSGNDPHVWRVDQLPYIFFRLCEKITALHVADFQSKRISSINTEISTHIAFLICALPRLFFFHNVSLHESILPLYLSLTADTIGLWRELNSGLITGLLAAVSSDYLRDDKVLYHNMLEQLSICSCSDSSSTVGFSRNVNESGGGGCQSIISDNLAEFFGSVPKLTAIIPQLSDKQLLRDITRGILSINLVSDVSDSADYDRLPRNCVVELMFVFVFNYFGVVETSLCQEVGMGPTEGDELTGDQHADEMFYCVRVFDLLRNLLCFILVCIEECKSTLNIQQSVSLTQSGSTNEDVENYSMCEVAVLLSHFPSSAFAHNPWEVAHIFSLEDDGGVSSSSLSELLLVFSDRIQIPIDELSGFLNCFYDSTPAVVEERSTNTAGIIMKFRRSVVRSQFSTLLMGSRTMRLLSLNSDLLKWEFSRCLACFRVPCDPFTSDVLVPCVIDNGHSQQRISSQSTSRLVSYATAQAWAKSYGFSDEDISLHLQKISCLTGSTLSNYLSFSIFVVFAVRCFTERVSEISEDAFVDEIRRMLHEFSKNVSKVQQSTRARVLRLLFSNRTNYSTVQTDVLANDFALILQFSVKILDDFLTSCSKYVSRVFKFLPPRPPTALWDAPRFVGYCRHIGVLCDFEFSVEMVWVAYGLCLRELSPKTSLVWDTDCIVPPVPLLIGESDVLLQLCKCLLLLANSVNKSDEESSPVVGFNEGQVILTTADLHSVVTAFVAMSVDGACHDLIPATQHHDKSHHPLMEDILRYGGSEAVGSLSDCQDYLLESYCRICEQSKILHMSPFGNSDNESLACEASLNLVCKFFSSCQILRLGAVAVQAKLSLHSRLRPIYLCKSVQSQSDNKPTEDVTLCFAEFEELFIRCAFTLWETSGAIYHATYMPNMDNSCVSGDSQSTLYEKIAALYSEGCSKVYNMRVVSVKTKSSSRKRAWGVDFIAPFLSILKHKNDNDTKNVSRKPENNNNRASAFLNAITVTDSHLSVWTDMNTSSAQQSSPRDGNILSEILSNSRLICSVSDPASRVSTSVAATKSNSYRVANENISGDSPKQQLHTSRQVIASSIERVHLLQESSEQFVEALDTLLVGTREALWPVYATYCSCGDSVDPGKLSGPNLFTLLSKLGVLTDHMLLSDIGVLLHHISAHTFCVSALNAVTSLPTVHNLKATLPSLTFEEFLVFLCAFSKLRFEGILLTANDLGIEDGCLNADGWFGQWQKYMGSSQSFRMLLVECILPVLRERTLLAFPEDARTRDRFSCVFAVEVLIAIESAERPIQQFFQWERQWLENSDRDDADSAGISGIVMAMKRIRLVPNVMQEGHLLQLIADVLPERQQRETVHSQKFVEQLLFPQWEWVLSVVACQAVETAIQQSDAVSIEKIPGLVADVIMSIANAMVSDISQTN